MAFLAAMAVVSAVLITLAPAAPRRNAPGSGVARRSVDQQTRVASAIGTGGDADRRLRLVSHRCDRIARPVVPSGKSAAQSRLRARVERQHRCRGATKVAAQLASDATVQSVAGAWRMPMGNSLPTTAVKASTTNIATSVGYTGVSPNASLFDIRIVRGRPFTPAEAAAGSAVALVSNATAAALWPGLDPIGQTVEVATVPDGRSDARLPRGRVQVIGVAEDVSNGAIMDGIDATCVYFLTDVHGPANMALLVRGRTDDDIAPLAVTAAVNRVAPDTPFQLFSLRAGVADTAWGFRGISLVISCSALSACCLPTRGRTPWSRS